MFKQNPLTALRKVGLALVTFLPYLDALTNPVHDDANTLTDRVILLFLGVVMVAFFVNHITKPISYTIESLKSFSPLIPLVLFAGVYWGSYWEQPFARRIRALFSIYVPRHSVLLCVSYSDARAKGNRMAVNGPIR